MPELYPGATKIAFISCPICGMQKPAFKKGSVATMKRKKLTKGIKGLQHFNGINVLKHHVVRVCACLGRGKGFPKVAGINLAELKNDPKYSWIADELREQCNAILVQLGEGENGNESTE